MDVSATTSTSPQSLFEVLKAPQASELTRKRKVDYNPVKAVISVLLKLGVSWRALTPVVMELVERTKPFFPYVRNALAMLGAGYLLKTALQEAYTIANGLHTYFLAPRGLGRLNLKRYGEWAVVTGASEGIGRGYALELARQGLDVVIMSRSQEKLQAVADEIKNLYNRKVLIVPVDFTDGQQVYEDIAKQLADLDIGILVNNVGLSYLHPDYFLEVPEMRHRNIIELNCQVMVQMTYLLLPRMLEKGGGVIVNLSSVSDVLALPLLTTYSATKKFVCYFSDGIRREYGNKGILVQTVSAGMVTTTMSNTRRVSFLVPDPVSYARAAVATIGIQRYTHGYWTHALQMYLLHHLLPDWLYLRVGSRRMHWARRRLLYRKTQGTLVSQLKEKQTI